MKFDLLNFFDKVQGISAGINVDDYSPIYIGLDSAGMTDETACKYSDHFLMFVSMNTGKTYKEILEMIVKRSIKNKKIKQIRLAENELIKVYYDDGCYLTVDYDNYSDIKNIIKILSNRSHKDFMNKYVDIQDNIDNVYIYDSSVITSFEYEINDKEKMENENNLYIFYNKNNELLNNSALINNIIYYFIENNDCDSYKINKNGVQLGFENNKNIIIQGKSIIIYKELLECFKNKLIDNKVKKLNYKRKEDK